MSTLNLQIETPETKTPGTAEPQNTWEPEIDIQKLWQILETLPDIMPEDEELFRKALANFSGVANNAYPVEPCVLNDVIRFIGAMNRCLLDIVVEQDEQIISEKKRVKDMESRIRKMESWTWRLPKVRAFVRRVRGRISRGPYNVY